MTTGAPPVSWSPMSKEWLQAPAATGRFAEADLQAGFEVAEGQPFAEVRLPARAPRARRLDPAGLTREDRDDRDAPAVARVAVTGVTDDLVTGHERERHDG